jgi:hypothetical protein
MARKDIGGKKRSFFFLNGKLHRVLHVNRGRDLVTAWHFDDAERKVYLWSDVRKKMQTAFTISEVARMMGRHPDRIWRYIAAGAINPPQQAYTIDDRRNPTINFYSEDDVLEIHEYMTTIHRGRPRKDGRITNNMPNRDEIRSMTQTRRFLYVKDDDGKFVPVWREDMW